MAYKLRVRLNLREGPITFSGTTRSSVLALETYEYLALTLDEKRDGRIEVYRSGELIDFKTLQDDTDSLRRD